MKTREQVLALLRSQQGNYISGQEIGDTLHVTRSAVWKAIKALRDQGHEIQAVTNLGYRLPAKSDQLSESRILMYLEEGIRHSNTQTAVVRSSDHSEYPTVSAVSQEMTDSNRLENLTASKNSVGIHTVPSSHVHTLHLHIYDTIDSTNEEARRYIFSHPDSAEDQIFISNEQTAGRGRRGRAFYSASDTGIYMTLLLHPNMEAQRATLLTGMTAAASAEAIEEVTGIAVQIKWVNDLFLKNRKIAGILTEGTTSLEDGILTHVSIGIGINLFPPADGFPKELQDIAGSLFPAGNAPEDLRNRLIASILRHFYAYYENLDQGTYLESYRSRSYLDGKWVQIHPSNLANTRKDYARVLGIDDEMHLIVEHGSGRREVLSTGEVSVVRY